MATYKVIQDIEAEDKFVGPLTLKQFIFAMTGCFFGWMCFFFLNQFPLGLIVSLPLALFGFFMAFPWSKEQPTDVWVLAKIRFYTKPKKRIWDQSGREDLVTITAPKKIEKHLTKDFSETEVKSRLKALAETIDSRGWAVKHATAGQAGVPTSTDRLVDTAILPPQVPNEADTMTDIMENSKVDDLLEQKEGKRREEIIEKMDQARTGDKHKPKAEKEDVVTPPPIEGPKTKKTADRIDEMLLNDKIKASRAAKNVAYAHLSTIPAAKSAPTAKQDDDEDEEKDAKTKISDKAKSKKSKTEDKKSTSTVTEQISPDIINLARNNDLNVATIARQVNAGKPGESDEVVISLH